MRGTNQPTTAEGDVTVDALLRGRVTLVQPRRGFRASLDPILLSGFLSPPFGHFLDIGCGTGAVAFLLLARDARSSGVGVELQARLHTCLAEGARRNGWGERLALHLGDVVAWSKGQPSAAFDLVATNPPFRRGSPRSPHPERAQAHHEVSLELQDWIAVAARLVKPTGRVAAIFDAARSDELADALDKGGLTLVRRRLVCPHEGAAPSRVLIEATPAVGSAREVEEAPLIVHVGSGPGHVGFSAEVARWLGDQDQAEDDGAASRPSP